MSRRKLRRAARKVFARAAKDMGITQLRLAERLDGDDDEALAAIAAVYADRYSAFPYDELIAMIWAIVQFLLAWLTSDPSGEINEK